eukprot:Nitzschia sp. Nitz4//scaffold42_size132992//40883//41554//NITZ4_003389-RA/size132992-processed-gene-0.32-mRNA-1//-1//CDS//3329551688//2880//frame0
MLPQQSLTKQAIKRLVSSLKTRADPPKYDEDNEHACATESSFSSPTKRKKDKKVAFSKVVKVVFTPGRNDLTAEEQALTWYQRSEYHAISAENRELLGKLRRGEVTECPRGLERHTKQGKRRLAKAVQERGTSAISVVLIEQHRQVKEGVANEDHIAFLYHSASSSSRLFSNMTGLKDQEAAELTYREEGSTGKQILALFGVGRVNTMRKATIGRNKQGASAA